MSKTKSAGTTHYEILFIIPNKFTEDESKTVAGTIEKVIIENEGTITHREYWGKKKLAYEIKGNVYGYYGLFEFDLEGKFLATIDQTFRLLTEILRHQIVIKKTKTKEELAKDEKIQAKIDSKKAAIEKQETEQEKIDATPAKKDKRANLKDLDKKLEDIINADNLL